MGCNDAAQQATWCPTSVDETLPSILGLLPSGPAWDGAQQPGTNMNMFWRSIASLTGWAYGRLCDYWKEFYCDTASESLDQWMADYGLPDHCDPYGDNLCAKVTAIGGQDCATFTAMAKSMGWVITCENMTDTINEAYAGTMIAGCAQCSTTPIRAGDVQPSAVATGSATAAGANTISFGTPPSSTPPTIPAFDSTGTYISWGQTFTWIVTLDMAASMALQGKSFAADLAISNAGNMVAGCTQLCSSDNPVPDALCWLEQVAPAHTVLVPTIIL